MKNSPYHGFGIRRIRRGKTIFYFKPRRELTEKDNEMGAPAASAETAPQVVGGIDLNFHLHLISCATVMVLWFWKLDRLSR
jgi:hypothetical protein